SGGAGAEGIGAGCDSFENRAQGVGNTWGAGLLDRLPVIRTGATHRGAVRGHRKRTYWIAFQPLCRGDRRTEVEEGIHVDLVVKDAHSAAHYEISTCGWLIGKTNAGRKVIPVLIEDRVGVLSLDEQSLSWNKICQIFPVTVERSEILVAHSQIQVQLGGKLP